MVSLEDVSSKIASLKTLGDRLDAFEVADSIESQLRSLGISAPLALTSYRKELGRLIAKCLGAEKTMVQPMVIHKGRLVTIDFRQRDPVPDFVDLVQADEITA